jgi:predicted ATPase
LLIGSVPVPGGGVETRLYIELFGGLRVLEGQRVIDRFRTQKTGALLAYLACHPDQMHSRELLAEMIWPESDLPAARNNISVALSHLRAQLEPPGVPPNSVFVGDRRYIRIGPAVSTDVQQFEKLLTRADRAPNDAERAKYLTQAVLLYRGDLLPGMYEDWVLPRQEQLAGHFLTALDSLAKYHEKENRLEEAIRFAQRFLDSNSLRIAGTESEQETMASVVRLLNAWRQNAVAPSKLVISGGRVMMEGGAGGAHSLARNVLNQAHSSASERAVRVMPNPGKRARHPEPPRTPPTGPTFPRSYSANWNPARAVPPPPAPAPVPAPVEPPLAAPPPLPRPATRFFGREAEQMQLGWLLRTPSSRLITLIGPGGSGKTRLAMEAARELRAPEGMGGYGANREEFEEEADARNIYFVPLSELSDPAHLPAALVGALGLSEDPKAGDPLNRVVTTLARTPSLLVLDNAEHLIDAVATLIHNLLERLPNLLCLVTSRQRLQLPEEQVLVVGPLAAPTVSANNNFGVDVDPKEVAAEYPAVALFVDRAQRTRPDFQLTTKNLASVAQLVSELDGIPLAIELAAARAFLLTPQQMVEQMQQHRFNFLNHARRGVPDRHLSLWNTLEWSARLLPPGARTLLSRLSVFRGGWSLEAAFRVVGDDVMLDDLALLADASLVEMRTVPGMDPESETTRYYLLEAVREFAREKLETEAPDEVAELSARHAAWCADLTEEAEVNLRGAQQVIHLDRLAIERDNLRTALAWCITTGSYRTVSLALRIFGGAHRFYLVRGVDEGRRHFRALLGALENLSEAEHETLTEPLAKARNAAGVQALSQGDLADAREQFAVCLALRRQQNNPRGIATVLNNLALVEMDEDNLDDAVIHQTESLEIWRRLGEDRLVATTQANIAIVSMRREDYAQARALLSESLTYAMRTGDTRSAAVRRFNLAETYARLGEYRQAEPMFRECLRDFTLLGDMRNNALCILNLGFVAAGRKEWRTASRRIGAGLVWCQANGMQFPARWQNDIDRNITAIEQVLGMTEGAILRAARPSDFPTLMEMVAELQPEAEDGGRPMPASMRPFSI